MISLLDLEKTKKIKSIIYKAHIAKKTTKWTCKTAKIKLMIDTPTHYHTPTHTDTHTLTQVMRMQNLIQF